MKRLFWLIEFAILILLSLPFALLPMRIALKTGALLGSFVFNIWTSRRKIAIENIQKTIELGEIKSSDKPEKIALECFKNLGRSFIEIIKIYYGFGSNLVQAIEIRGLENFLKAKEKNKGIIMITGHCGNWELCALAISAKISVASGVARRQNNPFMNAAIEKVRAGFGNSIIYKQGALKSILSALKKNSVVGILIDQAVVSDEGYIIDFLGRGAWATKMPALIARKTGAPVLPVFIKRENSGHLLTVCPEIELSALEDKEEALIADTKQLMQPIEEYIRQNPYEWLWIHRRWKRVPPLTQ
ncbi:MAG: lysophospholipid acyltransferase family protein [Nitrospirae bacterium]|nr:lysophospholipid acyltransferase family protein [Nitrospirota bacterium]